MCEFELMYALNDTTIQVNQSYLKRMLLQASGKKQCMLCRLLTEKIKTHENSSSIVENALEVACQNEDRHTIKAISWGIVKFFWKKYHQHLCDAIDIYPGMQCACTEECHDEFRFVLCSDTKIITVVTRNTIDGLPEVFFNFTIEMVNPSNFEADGSESTVLTNLLSESKESFYLKTTLESFQAEMLFDAHSNLTLICPSIFKSTMFKTFHIVKHEICFRLYCKRKGIIPSGENHFPGKIRGIPTDVIEGYPECISKLRIGDTIGTNSSAGTLGGFVRYLDFDCFLTCAHVMYDLQTLLASSSDFARLSGATAYLYSPIFPNGKTECGKVMFRAFDHSVPVKTSIDAALVLLQNNVTMDPNDYILDQFGNPCDFRSLGLSSQYLNSNCLDHEQFCSNQQFATTVSPGAKTKLEQTVQFPKQSDIDVYFSNISPAAGSVNSTFFTPLWIHSPAHIQLSTGNVSAQRVFRMYNQIVLNLPLQPGDSGTCIYIVQHPSTNGCIGMAIAFCGGVAIVTPLKDILKRINAI